MTFRVSFGHNDADGRQALELRRLDGDASRDRMAEGVILAHGRTGDQVTGEGGVLVWAGVAGEPFYAEPTVLGAIRKAVANGSAVDLTGWNKERAVNALANTTVSSIVLEVPDDAFDTATIGFWGATALAADAGGWRQINRAGQPMIQPIFNPDDSERLSAYNTTRPREDRGLYGPRSSAGSLQAWSPRWGRVPTRKRTAKPSPRSASRTSCATRSVLRQSSALRSGTAGP